MRIWDLPPRLLCRNHLLGEHRELHAIWSILTRGKTGYAHHPETMRWRGRLRALHRRHERLVMEMSARSYRHRTPLNRKLATGKAVQDRFVDPPSRQRALLKAKRCACKVSRRGA